MNLRQWFSLFKLNKQLCHINYLIGRALRIKGLKSGLKVFSPDLNEDYYRCSGSSGEHDYSNQLQRHISASAIGLEIHTAESNFNKPLLHHKDTLNI